MSSSNQQPSNNTPFESVWDYLERTGVLDHGTADDIEQAKRDYWALYRLEHKRASRKRRPEITVSFESLNDLAFFRDAAQEHGRTLSVFMRESARAYLDQSYLQPDPSLWQTMRAQLNSIAISLHNLSEDVDSPTLLHRTHELSDKLISIELTLEEQLTRPERLEDAIRRTANEAPWRIQPLKKLLESSDL